MTNSKKRIPYEETDALALCERLYRKGLDTASTEQVRGEIVMAAVDIALSKLCVGATPYAVTFYRDEETRGDCLLKALEALEKADAEDGRAMLNYVVRSVQNHARNMVEAAVLRTKTTIVTSDFDEVPEENGIQMIRANRIFLIGGQDGN